MNRETGDFLVWIAPDWEPPHWTWFAFWWRERLFRVGLDDHKTHPDTGYCVEIAGVAAEDGKLIFPKDRLALATALFEAVQVYATADAATLFDGLRQSKKVPLDPPGTPPIELQCTLNDLSVSPCATFRIDFPRSIR